MKLIIDTNIVLSALFKPKSTSAVLLAHWRSGSFAWASCAQQMAELGRVLVRPKILPLLPGGSNQAQALLTQMDAHCEFFALAPPFPALCRDPKDDYLLALLQRSESSYLISGDKDLLALKGQLPILTLRELIDLL